MSDPPYIPDLAPPGKKKQKKNKDRISAKKENILNHDFSKEGMDTKSLSR